MYLGLSNEILKIYPLKKKKIVPCCNSLRFFFFSVALLLLWNVFSITEAVSGLFRIPQCNTQPFHLGFHQSFPLEYYNLMTKQVLERIFASAVVSFSWHSSDHICGSVLGPHYMTDTNWSKFSRKPPGWSGTGTFNPCREAEGGGLEKRWVWGTAAFQLFGEVFEKMEPSSSQWGVSGGWEATGTRWNKKSSDWMWGSLYPCESSQPLEQAV